LEVPINGVLKGTDSILGRRLNPVNTHLAFSRSFLPPNFMAPPTADDLRRALARYDAEARPGAFHTGRYRLHYATWGDTAGRPLVFVHGLADVPRSFAMVMRPLVEAGYRCVGYDLADGRDDGANLGMYRHPHYADDLVALLDHLHIAQADVLGSSFGSTVTLRALATYPASHGGRCSASSAGWRDWAGTGRGAWPT
jgi:alpha-beta hydrolase superfamily lysophospholipase